MAPPSSAPNVGVLAEENGFRYRVATEESADAAGRILSASFACEPMAVALGVSADDLAPLVASFLPECTTNGLSVLAAPVDEPGTVAGVFICRDFKSPLPPSVVDDFPWFHPAGAAITAVDEAYEAQRPGLALGNAVDLWMVGVTPGSRFARRGIARTLFRVCVDLARARGFSRCVTECTGRYSQTAARTAGFEERARLAYRDFRFHGRPVFAAIPPPHTHLVFYEKVL